MPGTLVSCVPLWQAGSLDVPSSAMEMDLAKAGMHMLIEKPISMRPAEEVERLGKVISETFDAPRRITIPKGRLQPGHYAAQLMRRPVASHA